MYYSVFPDRPMTFRVGSDLTVTGVPPDVSTLFRAPADVSVSVPAERTWNLSPSNDRKRPSAIWFGADSTVFQSVAFVILCGSTAVSTLQRAQTDQHRDILTLASIPFCQYDRDTDSTNN